MKKSIAKNYIYNLVYQIVVIILPIITTPYISRILGAEGVGIYSYTISITTYFILFGSLGVAMYAQREIAYVQDDKEKRSKIFWEVFLLRCLTLIFSLILFYFMYARSGEYSFYYKILIIEIIANIFDISCFFQGIEEFKKIIIRNLIVKVISIISIFVFIKTELDVWKYLLIHVLSTLLGNTSLWLYLPKYIQKVSIKDFNLKSHIKPTLILFIPQIAVQIYTVLDKTMIGAFINDKSEVGFYEQSQKIVKIILTIVTSLGIVMLPRMANKFAKGQKKEIKENIINSFNFVYFLSMPMMFGLIAIANTFIIFFLGGGFEKSIIITSVISPIILMIGMSNVIGVQYLLPTKRQKEYTISVMSGAVINLILNCIFIPKYMSVGAAIATVIAEIVVTGVQLFFVRKEFNIKEIIFLMKKYFISSIVMFIIVVLLGNLNIVDININEFRIPAKAIKLTIQVAIGIIVYLISLLSMKDKYTKYILSRCCNLIKIKKI